MGRVLGRMTEPPDMAAVVLVESRSAQLSPACWPSRRCPRLWRVEGDPRTGIHGRRQSEPHRQYVHVLTVRTKDEAAAKQLEEIIDQMLAMARAGHAGRGYQTGGQVPIRSNRRWPNTLKTDERTDAEVLAPCVRARP